MLSLSTKPTQTTESKATPPRCKDCDSDCWAVPRKLHCWLGNAECDIAEGYCPWLMEGLALPPKQETQ